MPTEAERQYEEQRGLEAVGLTLDREMRRQKVTVNQIAQKSEMTPDLVQRILDGQEPGLDLGTIFKLADALDCRLEPVPLRKL